MTNGSTEIVLLPHKRRKSWEPRGHASTAEYSWKETYVVYLFFEVRNGVRQGDALACLLFNLALEWVIRMGINSKGIIFIKTVQLITYTDDVVIDVSTRNALSEAWSRLSVEKLNLVINEDKTKYMPISKPAEYDTWLYSVLILSLSGSHVIRLEIWRPAGWRSWLVVGILLLKVAGSETSRDLGGGWRYFQNSPVGRTATAGSDVVQSGRPIFDDFFQHLWPYIGNNTANVVFQMVKRLWLIRIDQ
ncbi:reverse transcriptase domain-containing protein [Trichonephila clavipes]|nr:reverse transcriptase domain-containing protein [Trichonephila clavipes]